MVSSASYRLSRTALAVFMAAALLVSALTAVTSRSTGTPQLTAAGGYVKAAYFDQWGIYGNSYYVKNLDTEGIASKLNFVIYDFENIDPVNLTCFETIKASDASNESDPNAGDGAGDAYADYQDEFTAANTVNGVADVYNQPIRGNFNQLKELKAKYPGLKVILSIGGWTYSKYFSDVSATSASRAKFVSSCVDMFIKGNLPAGIMGDPAGGPGTGAGIFDGFDLDWEYPGVMGHLGNHVSPNDGANFTLLLKEFRTELDAYGATTGKHYFLTAALPSGQDKIAQIQTSQIGNYLDFGDIMTYDMHGAWEMTTNFQAPIHSSPSDPSTPLKYNIDTTFATWVTNGGYPAGKFVLGVPFYGRGWTGVAAGANFGLYQAASGASAAFPLTQEPGVADYRELEAAGITASANMHFDSTTQSAWAYTGSNFYTFDTPQTLNIKDAYIKAHGLAGVFAFSLMADDSQSTLLNAMVNGLAGSGPTPTPVPSHTPTPVPTHTPTPAPTPSTPGPATNITAVGGAGQATVTWTAPANDGGGTINYYALYAFSYTGTPKEIVVAGTSTTVTGLAPGNWVFTVTPWNGHFWGPWCNWSSWTTVS